MIEGIKNTNLDRTIGIDYMLNRKKPCLVIKDGNTEAKYATFNNEETAKEFMIKLAEMVGLDWSDYD